MINIVYTYLETPLNEQKLVKLGGLLPRPLQERIRCLKNRQDRQAAVLGKYLLHGLLQRHGYSNRCLHRLGFDRYGRPFIDKKIDFNISHTAGIVICAVTSTGRCGVDIEKVVPLDIVDLCRYLPTEQRTSIENCADSVGCFFKYWTIFESVIKADGRGLSIPFTAIKICSATAIFGKRTWFLREIDIDERYVCHLALSEDCHELVIEEVVLN